MPFWNGKRALVTGGAGFIGSHLVEKLLDENVQVRVVDNLERGSLNNLRSCSKRIEFIKDDLTEQKNCRKAVRGIDAVFNLAAKVGGIRYNIKHPGMMFTKNILINTMMLEAARQEEVDRFLCVSSACVYPRFCGIPTPETEGFIGEPEPTNRGYGWAKRMAELQAQLYTEEFGMKIAVVRPYNTYGPRDNFDPESSHVIAAIIKRNFDGENPLTVWGHGEQTRAFTYVTDVVKGMLQAIERYPKADPLNIGTEEEVKIKYLVGLIAELSGKNPKIIFDPKMPAGQPRRNADISKARKMIGYNPEISLKEGLKKTIGWYIANKSSGPPSSIKKVRFK